MILFIYKIKYTDQTQIIKKIIQLKNFLHQFLRFNDLNFKIIIIFENNQNVIIFIKNI